MRHQNWKQLLDDHVAAYQAKPFNWHGNNCTTFAAHWVQLATGLTPEVPETASPHAALRAVRSLGGLHADACRQLGEPVPGTFAQCGDVVILKMPRSRERFSYAMGICLGSSCAAPGFGGLMMLPITEAEAAWRV